MHYPYFVCILIGMPSQHLSTFVMFFFFIFLYAKDLVVLSTLIKCITICRSLYIVCCMYCFFLCFLFLLFFVLFFFFVIVMVYAKGKAVSKLMLSRELMLEIQNKKDKGGTQQDKTNKYKPSDQHQ